jgi:uncharacterized protein YndB with AHSA1/START domain
MKDQESIVLTRIFDAPRSRVFETWTRAEHLGKWYAPKGFTITDCAADPRPGGVFRMRWRAPWGGTFGIRGEYREVVPPVRLVIACTLEDEQRATSLEEIINVDFEQSGSRTKLLINSTARASGANAARMLAGLQKGWTRTVDRLGVLLTPSSQQEKTQKEM